jgi:hypothetical protein
MDFDHILRLLPWDRPDDLAELLARLGGTTSSAPGAGDVEGRRLTAVAYSRPSARQVTGTTDTYTLLACAYTVPPSARRRWSTLVARRKR